MTSTAALRFALALGATLTLAPGACAAELKVIAAGAADYFQKPLDYPRLFGRIRDSVTSASRKFQLSAKVTF
mgnify:CR=1 FL=1